MTKKELNKMSKDEYDISTGYITYLGFEERWYDGYYNGEKTDLFVSSLGRVYNKTSNNFSKLFVNGSGYLYCQSYYKYKDRRCTVLINRLVLESIMGQSKTISNAEADHINRNKYDNNIKNLQWLSTKDNLQKRHYNQKGENNNSAKYTPLKIMAIADLLQTGKYTVGDVAELFNMPKTSVNNIKLKIRWKHLLTDYDFSKVPNIK